MTRPILLYLVVTLGQLLSSAQNNSPMKVKYYNQESLIVQVEAVSDLDRQRTKWEIFATRRPNEQVLLDSFDLDVVFTGTLDPYYGDVRQKVQIGDAFADEDLVYFMLYKFGVISLNAYRITRGSSQLISNKFIHDAALGSYMNFGEPVFNVQMLQLTHTTVYIYDQTTDWLLKYDIEQDRISRLEFNTESEKRILDKSELFKKLDFGEGEDLMTTAVHGVLSEHGLVGKSKEIVIRGLIDEDYWRFKETGARDLKIITVFYSLLSEPGLIKAIRYDNYESQWIIGNYELIPLQ